MKKPVRYLTTKDMDNMADSLGEVFNHFRKEIIESCDIRREAALVSLREQNDKLLVRIMALEAKDRPTEGTVLDMRQVLGRRRAA